MEQIICVEQKRNSSPSGKKINLRRPEEYYLINSAAYLHLLPPTRGTPRVAAPHSSSSRPRFPWSHGQPVTGEHALMYACRKLAVDPLHVARIGDGGPAQNGDCHGADRPADGGKKPAPCNRNQPWSAPRVTREPTTYYTHTHRLTVCSCHAISTDWDMFRKRTGRCLAILPATTSNGGIKTHCGSTSSAASLRRQVCRASRGFCYFSALTGQVSGRPIFLAQTKSERAT